MAEKFQVIYIIMHSGYCGEIENLYKTNPLGMNNMHYF